MQSLTQIQKVTLWWLERVKLLKQTQREVVLAEEWLAEQEMKQKYGRKRYKRKSD